MHERSEEATPLDPDTDAYVARMNRNARRGFVAGAVGMGLVIALLWWLV